MLLQLEREVELDAWWQHLFPKVRYVQRDHWAVCVQSRRQRGSQAGRLFVIKFGLAWFSSTFHTFHILAPWPRLGHMSQENSLPLDWLLPWRKALQIRRGQAVVVPAPFRNVWPEHGLIESQTWKQNTIYSKLYNLLWSVSLLEKGLRSPRKIGKTSLIMRESPSKKGLK